MPDARAAVATAPATSRPLQTGAAIGAVGVALPESIRTNRPIAAHLGVAEEWIVARTGVTERRIAGPREGVVELATQAGASSLAAAGLDAADLDLVLVATMSHEEVTPAAAPVVTEWLGARAAGALDVDAACSGFVSALALAASAVEAGRARAVLVIGAEVMSRLTDPSDRSTAALFGDGAGAVVVTAAAGPSRIGPVVLGADGARADLVTASRAEAVIRMKGHDTFRQAVDRLCEATEDAVAAAGAELADVDLFVYHQANRRILQAVGDRLALDPERVVDCIGGYGNTSAATIPIALAEARTAGALRPGDSVLLAAFGGGLTWAATLVEWGLEQGVGGASDGA